MFLNREYIPAVPIREEQRVKEEEELARQLKREARIFFPDSRLPDFSTQDMPPLPDGPGNGEENPPQENRKPEDSSNADRVIIEDHDDVCREEDSAWRNPDGSFSRHDEIAAAREEADRIEANRNRQRKVRNMRSDIYRIGIYRRQTVMQKINPVKARCFRRTVMQLQCKSYVI